MKIWIKRILLSLGLLALIGIFYAAFALYASIIANAIGFINNREAFDIMGRF